MFPEALSDGHYSEATVTKRGPRRPMRISGEGERNPGVIVKNVAGRR